jgi:hypothetical protein
MYTHRIKYKQAFKAFELAIKVVQMKEIKYAESEATKVIVMVVENFQVDGWTSLINLQKKSIFFKNVESSLHRNHNLLSQRAAEIYENRGIIKEGLNLQYTQGYKRAVFGLIDEHFDKKINKWRIAADEIKNQRLT